MMSTPADMLQKAWSDEVLPVMVAHHKERLALRFEELLRAVTQMASRESEWDHRCRRAAEDLVYFLRDPS